MMAVSETQDGKGAGDHDEPYRFQRPSALAPFPFTEREYARLLMLRGLIQDHRQNGDMVTDGETWPV